MRQLILGLITTTTLLTSCSTNKENPSDIFTKVYSSDNILKQTFSIDASRDTVLKGKAGTTIRISKNTFTDKQGRLVNGNVDIQYKEVLTELEMVLGNLTTTTNGQPLQTGGMIYINATANNEQLNIADNKQIGIVIPTDSAKIGMQLFEGTQDSTGINWENPKSIENAIAPENPLLKDEIQVVEKGTKSRTNIGYIVKGFEDGLNIPAEVTSKMSDIAWGGGGLIISKDSMITIGSYSIQLVKGEIREFVQPDFVSYNAVPTKGYNSFIEDPKTNYIFSVKKLGWANIDRLLNDPRTKEVELITKIENNADFKTIYITMVTEKMFLPGYQMLNETFCFTHNDQEKTQLPIGATATIMATAYKNDKPYFSIQKIVISAKQSLNLKLVETTIDQLKKDLERQL